MSTIDAFAEVRTAVNLSTYVEATFGSRLRSRGQGKFSTACPVHGGDNPTAFTIDDTRGLWYCFSQCGSGGDIFDLWIATNPSGAKRDALEAVASFAGVTLPERDRRINLRDLHDVLDKAAGLFWDALVSDNPRIGDDTGADEAFAWITDERGVGDEEIAAARIGFVPDFPGLRSALESAIGDRKRLLQAGLLVETAHGSLYCPFAGRIVFPIRDTKGRVVGFGGRVVPDITRHQEPKFVNSRQSEVYDKSNVLYGIDKVDSESTKRVIVCEGYLDALAVNSLNVRGLVGVAACGTAVSASHVDLLSAVLPESATVTFAMDGDEAGQKSMARLTHTAAILGDRGFGILFDASSGKDPWDRYISGTLAEDLESAEQRPLLEAALHALLATAEGDEHFDDQVASLIHDAGTPDFADAVLRAASTVRAVTIGDYGEMVRRREMSSRTRRAHLGDENTRLSGPVRNLVARLMQESPAALRGVSTAFQPWDDRGRDLVDHWMPVEGPDDVAALGYVLFPRAQAYEPEIIQAVSSCMSRDDALESIRPTVSSVAKAALDSGARVSREAPPAVITRAKAARTLAAGAVQIEDEVVALVLLLDVARELDALDPLPN